MSDPIRVPTGATHIVFGATAGDNAVAPVHMSEPHPIESFDHDVGPRQWAGTLDDAAKEHMWETVEPTGWWIYVDKDGNEVEQ